jgi:hypothetical protein
VKWDAPAYRLDTTEQYETIDEAIAIVDGVSHVDGEPQPNHPPIYRRYPRNRGRR